jgi:hypothetical protein
MSRWGLLKSVNQQAFAELKQDGELVSGLKLFHDPKPKLHMLHQLPGLVGVLDRVIHYFFFVSAGQFFFPNVGRTHRNFLRGFALGFGPWRSDAFWLAVTMLASASFALHARRGAAQHGNNHVSEIHFAPGAPGENVSTYFRFFVKKCRRHSVCLSELRDTFCP